MGKGTGCLAECQMGSAGRNRYISNLFPSHHRGNEIWPAPQANVQEESDAGACITPASFQLLALLRIPIHPLLL